MYIVTDGQDAYWVGENGGGVIRQNIDQVQKELDAGATLIEVQGVLEFKNLMQSLKHGTYVPPEERANWEFFSDA